jgi:hypothetical protein
VALCVEHRKLLTRRLAERPPSETAAGVDISQNRAGTARPLGPFTTMIGIPGYRPSGSGSNHRKLLMRPKKSPAAGVGTRPQGKGALGLGGKTERAKQSNTNSAAIFGHVRSQSLLYRCASA